MTLRREFADHLQFFSELGVRGISRDPAWRTRVGTEVTEMTEDAETQTMSAAGDSLTQLGGFSATSATSAASVLTEIRSDLGDCTRCKLHKGRTHIVFGVGNPQARLMFVGEAPGADEDAQGEPFVGRAGQLLTKIIESIGLQRSDVYIANVIKCRPPNNRNPEPDEVSECQPFLFRQIDTIRPRVIVALGTHAAHALLNTDAPISRIRGKVHPYRHDSSLIPTFHPAYLLRSPERKRDVWDDMKKVRDLLASAD